MGAPAANVTSGGELVTTGSQVVTNVITVTEPRFVTSDQILQEINNKLTILINHMEFINNTTIREVETE